MLEHKRSPHQACHPCISQSDTVWRFRLILAPRSSSDKIVEVGVAVQILLNSLRRLLTVVPQTEHTLSRWCGSHSGQRPGSPHAAPPSPGRDGAPPPGALAHDGPGMHSPWPLHCYAMPAHTLHLTNNSDALLCLHECCCCYVA